MTVSEPDTALMKERIINWIKTDITIYDETKPEGDPIEGEISTKVTSVIFGVPEEENWEKELAPFISVSNADNFVTSDQFFGSVVNDELTSSYEKISFDIVLVVQAAEAETTERLIDSLHKKLKMRLKSNVQLKDVVTDTTDPNFGKLINGTEICATSRLGNTISLQAPMLSRRLFAYRIVMECEVQV